MTFAWPAALLGLVFVALALVAYLIAQRRRSDTSSASPTSICSRTSWLGRHGGAATFRLSSRCSP